MIRAYICSPLSAETEVEIRRNMLRARQFMKQIADIYGYRTYAPHAICRNCWMILTERKGHLLFPLI